MDKKKIIIIAVLVVVFAVAAYFLFYKSPAEKEAQAMAEDAAKQAAEDAIKQQAAAAAANIAASQAEQAQQSANQAVAEAAKAAAESQTAYTNNLRDTLSDTSQSTTDRGAEAEFQRQQKEIDDAILKYKKNCAEVDARNEKLKQDIVAYNDATIDSKFSAQSAKNQEIIDNAVKFAHDDMYGGNFHDLAGWKKINDELADDNIFAFFKLLYDINDEKGFDLRCRAQKWHLVKPLSDKYKEEMRKIIDSLLNRAYNVTEADLNKAYNPEPYPAKPQILIDNGL